MNKRGERIPSVVFLHLEMQKIFLVKYMQYVILEGQTEQAAAASFIFERTLALHIVNWLFFCFLKKLTTFNKPQILKKKSNIFHSLH